jgi:hypothetical protein
VAVTVCRGKARGSGGRTAAQRGNGQVCINQSSALRNLVNAVYTGINEAGGIS